MANNTVHVLDYVGKRKLLGVLIQLVNRLLLCQWIIGHVMLCMYKYRVVKMYVSFTGLHPRFHHECVWPQHQLWFPLQILPNVRKHYFIGHNLSSSFTRRHCVSCFRSHSTQVHLKNVYSSLAVCMFVAAAGSYVHVVTRLFQVMWHSSVCLSWSTAGIRTIVARDQRADMNTVDLSTVTFQPQETPLIEFSIYQNAYTLWDFAVQYYQPFFFALKEIRLWHNFHFFAHVCVCLNFWNPLCKHHFHMFELGDLFWVHVNADVNYQLPTKKKLSWLHFVVVEHFTVVVMATVFMRLMKFKKGNWRHSPWAPHPRGTVTVPEFPSHPVFCSLTWLWGRSQGGVLSVLGSLGMMCWLAMTPHNSETETKRLAILAGFAFLTGRLMQLLVTADETVI